MEDCYINEPLFCCGVALLAPFMADHFNPDSVTKLLDPEHRILTQSIGQIFPAGTCFIIAKSNRELKLRNSKVVALALTNYHVAYNLENRSKNTGYYVGFNIDMQLHKYIYEPILELNSLISHVQRSVTSGMPYCLPNDLSLILIIQADCGGSELREVEFHNQEDLESINSIIVSGYPILSDPQYVLPDCQKVSNYKQKIQDGFHYFKYQIISEGTMNITDTGLTELRLSATNGMSGSPLLAKVGDWFKCVGIYCGGPPLEGQRELMEMLDFVNTRQFEAAKSIFHNLPFDNGDLFSCFKDTSSLRRDFIQYMVLNNAMDSRIFEFGYRSDYRKMQTRISKFGMQDCLDSALIDLQDSIKRMLLATVKCYKETSKFCFNAGISINTEAFSIVKKAIDIFRNLHGDFESGNEIENLMKGLLFRN